MATTNEYEERDLLQRIAQGEEPAFARLYRHYTPSLARFIFSLTRSEAVVDEIIQEVFLRVWVSRDKLPGINNVQAWLFKITANICYTWLRRKIKERNVIDTIAVNNPQQAEDPQPALQAKALAKAIGEAVDQLSPQRRKVYQMSREQEMKQQDIAEELGVSLSTVKGTLGAALQAIRDHLQRAGYTISLLLALLVWVTKK